MKRSWGHFTGWTKKSQIIKKALRNYHHGKATKEQKCGLSCLPRNSKCVKQLNYFYFISECPMHTKSGSTLKRMFSPFLFHECVWCEHFLKYNFMNRKGWADLREVSQALSSNTVTLDLIISSLCFTSLTLNILWKVAVLNIHWLQVAGRGTMHAFWVPWNKDAREMYTIYEIEKYEMIGLYMKLVMN